VRYNCGEGFQGIKMDNTNKTYNYSPPVSNLLTYGDCRDYFEWPNYLDMGFTNKDVPDLIRMALDPDLNFADSDSSEVWAPIHAWRVLGQMRAEAAIEALLPLFHMFEDDDNGGGSDWVSGDLAEVYALFGAKAIPALSAYLEDASHGDYPRSDVSHTLVLIAQKHPDTRSQCVELITRELTRFKENSFDLNAFYIADLIDLKAIESLDVIQQAFDADRVETSIVGEFYDVQLDLGVIELNPEIERQRQIDAEKRTKLFQTILGESLGDIDDLIAYDESVSKEEYKKQLKVMRDSEKKEKKKTKAKRKQTEKIKKRNRKRK
jgi:hypothetical protein